MDDSICATCDQGCKYGHNCPDYKAGFDTCQNCGADCPKGRDLCQTCNAIIHGETAEGGYEQP